MGLHRQIFAAFILISSLNIALGSVGDRSPAFQDCVSHCLQTCDHYDPNIFLRLTFWSCHSNCDYLCTQKLTNAALGLTNDQIPLNGLPTGRMVQYFGKWPFVRYFGIQEILSVIFSLFNLYMHFKGYQRIRICERTAKPKLTYRSQMRHLAKVYQIYSTISMISWIASAIFHIRDLLWTQWFDYVFAGGAILAGLHSCIYRVFLWPHHPKLALIWAVTCIIMMTCHCLYLLRDFDFSYNMKANLIVGSLQIVIWNVWCLITSPRQLWRTFIPLGLLLCSALLEVNDFAPIPKTWRLLDAHALWHLATVPVTYLWYNFMVWDLNRV